jgi:hypothetical protein
MSHSDLQRELAVLYEAQRQLKQHASLQPLVSAVRQARFSLRCCESSDQNQSECARAAVDTVAQALKRQSAVPPAAGDCVKNLHDSLSKLGRSIEQLLPQSENIEATIPPLPASAHCHMRRSLLDACVLSLATLGHVDAAEQLSSSTSPSRSGSNEDDMSCNAQTVAHSSAFDHYRRASNLRCRLQSGDVEAAAEVEQLLRGGNHRLLLLKLHRAVTLQLLLFNSCDESGVGPQQMLALAYARDRLPPFLNDPPPAPAIVSQIMGIFAFARLLKRCTSSSSCPCLYSQELQHWSLPSLALELHSAVLVNADLPAASPLDSCVRMALHALPPLLKYKPPFEPLNLLGFRTTL